MTAMNKCGRQIKEILVSDIEFGERFREDYGDLSDLVKSIKDCGLINPITVKQNPTGNYTLMAGGRRLTAIKEYLKYEYVTANVYLHDLTQLELRTIELEENLRRKDLSFVEECNLKREIHELYTNQVGHKTSTTLNTEGWSQRSTANLLGRSQSEISRDIKLAEAMESMPEIKWEKFKTKADAHKALKKMEETVIAAELAKRAESKKGNDSAKKQLMQSFIVGDFFEHAKKLPNESFELVEIDPPYSIELETIKKDYQYGNTYNEVPNQFYHDFMLNTLNTAYTKAAKHAWLICWFGLDWFETMYSLISQSGWATSRMIGVWTKLTGQANQPNRYLASAFEGFFYARKGDPVIAKAGRTNVFRFDPVPAQQKTHPTERPLDLMQEVLSTFAFEGARVLVPFAGSGATLLSAYLCGMSGIGFDLTKEYKDSFIVKCAKL